MRREFSYWLERERIADQLLDRNHLQRKISKISFSSSTDKIKEVTWADTADANDIVQTDAILHRDKKLFREQADQLKHPPEAITRATRKLFMKWFTRLPPGLGVSLGRRDTKLQSRFKDDLVKAYGVTHPGSAPTKPVQALMWCPVLGRYVDQAAMTAAHIFGYALGQELMTEIFGDEEGERDELFSPKNGMMMHSEAEKRFDKGLIVFVPSVDDESAEAIQAWHKSETKAYKIHVLDTTAPKMKEAVPGEEYKNG